MELQCVLLSIVLCCSAGLPAPPVVRLNGDFLLNRSEVALTAGSAFNLSCRGDGAVRWWSSAFRLTYLPALANPLQVGRADPRHTGTYRCRYANRSREHTWIHLYVTDPARPSQVFVSPRSVPVVTEGEDYLLRCLLTDPSVTNLTVQSESSGRGLPPGLSVTFDPRRGALLRGLKVSGRFLCSGWKHGRQLTSAPVDLLVVRRLRSPPSLFVTEDEVVRLEGEKFEVTCVTSNPSHFYNLTWTHTHLQVLNVSSRARYAGQRLFKNATVAVAAVGSAHAGGFTCSAANEAGVATATTHLRVLGAPYLRIYLQQANANANANASAVGGRDANASRASLEQKWLLIANASGHRVGGAWASRTDVSGSSTVEAWQGRDVTLTLLIDSYPPIDNLRWTTPTHLNGTCEQSYTANGLRREASLAVFRVRPEDGGRFCFHFSNAAFRGTQSIELKICRPPSSVIRVQNGSLTCSSSGHPLPTILWFCCPGVQLTCGDLSTNQVPAAAVTSQGEESVSQLTLPASPDDDVTVECVAFNPAGKSRQVFIPSVRRDPVVFFSPVLVGGLSAASALLLLLAVLYRWTQKPKYEIRWKIIESTNGNHYTFIDPSQLPYNHKWEFPRDKLRLGAVLGSGAFGKVVEGTAYGLQTENDVTRVAVKMLKPSAHSEEREALMSELKILGHLGYHDNIVNLLGACTRGGPMLMITEYCSHGDLLNFLRFHAEDFMAAILSEEAVYKNMAATHNRLRSDSGISCCSEYQEMQPMNPGQLGVQTACLSLGDLLRFSFQVAQALDFLSSRNCIHRDVAARNVLLTDRRDAKICDFGLARDIQNDDNYIVQGNARLPVKWMAPESIFQCVYTVQSDVWSYGVLLWEIFSLGKSPYPNIAVDTKFYRMIKDGRHMDQPEFSPPEMYRLMALCWSLEPTERPTFKMIGQLINRLLPPTNEPHSEQSYRNMDECREEEEEEDSGQRGLHDDEEKEEEEPPMKNIYQLS